MTTHKYVTCSFCGNDKDFKLSLGIKYRLNLAKQGEKPTAVVKWYGDTITCLNCGASAKINKKF